MKQPGQTALQAVADRLRAMSLAAEEGDPLGGEEALTALMGCSRSTIRQAARLLEREGMLRVRRGQYGGYFAARPTADIIESVMSTYLGSLDVKARETTVIASALWVEAMRAAASAAPDRRHAMVDQLRPSIAAVKEDASFSDVRQLELQSQNAVFELAETNYIKIIFEINIAFSRRHMTLMPSQEASPLLEDEFVRDWQRAKLIEIGAIAEGKPELAALAGHYSRQVWEKRIAGLRGEPAPGSTI
jgi:GntR family transcriptional regulator, transcriptional repressor for pyruvate dehydrogenase complex